MEYKLYVGNLSYTTTETDLQTLFTQAGAVKSVALIKDRDSGRSKGFAFVEMVNPAGYAERDQHVQWQGSSGTRSVRRHCPSA